MFITCSEKQGSAYFEFQYCKKEFDIKNTLKKDFSFWEKDSLLVHIDYDIEFFDNYADYLKTPDHIENALKFDAYGVNYYTKEQALTILNMIKKDKPKDFEVFVEWLDKATTEYNGFFFLGI